MDESIRPRRPFEVDLQEFADEQRDKIDVAVDRALEHAVDGARALGAIIWPVPTIVPALPGRVDNLPVVRLEGAE